MSGLLQGKVAIITGAANGLGRAHAFELARHGARVVVNDIDTGAGLSAANDVVNEIRSFGGEAIAVGGNVTIAAEMEALVEQAVETWGRVDILVNNAGILRDKTFAKMSLDEFRVVMEVHLFGAVNATKAVWNRMREQKSGRIVMTTSSSGLYGNFGQSNYGAAKMALVGLMQTLALEGASNNIRVNCLAPTAATAMTTGVLPQDALARLQPEKVSPGLLALVSDDAPTRMILLAGSGAFEAAHITMTQGVFIEDADDVAVQVKAQLKQIDNRGGEVVPGTGFEQCQHELVKSGIEAASMFSNGRPLLA